VSLVSTVFLFAGPLAILAWIAVRDHCARSASRRALLGDCESLFDRYALTHEGDSFPRLSGRIGTHNVDVRLVSDTMTIRRLPQLWLQVTVLERLQGVSGLAILVRPSGYEFYSLTSDFHHVIEPPASFPRELIVRGKDARSDLVFERLAPAAAAILADPQVKEVAITPEGFRIVRQASEGRRGDYLLLRQAVFDENAVPASVLEAALSDIEGLRQSLETAAKAVAHA
jgi:hypothetical protein